MTNRFSRSVNTRKLVYTALLTALVVVLQFAGSFIRLGTFSCSLVLPPIVIGVALCGPLAGAWLGAVFGLMVFATGDAALFLAVNPAATILVVMVKGIAAGLVAGLLYRLIARRGTRRAKQAATVTAAVAAPLVNTGLFLVGCALFFYDTVLELAAVAGFESGVAYMFLGLAGGNFLLELIINLVLCPAILLILDVIAKRRTER